MVATNSTCRSCRQLGCLAAREPTVSLSSTVLAATLCCMVKRAKLLIIIIISHFLPRGKVRPADELQLKAATILPLVGLARSKQDPVTRGHGAQYLYRPPPAGAKPNHCKPQYHPFASGCLHAWHALITFSSKVSSFTWCKTSNSILTLVSTCSMPFTADQA